jgi:hypothetical protein
MADEHFRTALAPYSPADLDRLSSSERATYNSILAKSGFKERGVAARTKHVRFVIFVTLCYTYEAPSAGPARVKHRIAPLHVLEKVQMRCPLNASAPIEVACTVREPGSSSSMHLRSPRVGRGDEAAAVQVLRQNGEFAERVLAFCLRTYQHGDVDGLKRAAGVA